MAACCSSGTLLAAACGPIPSSRVTSAALLTPTMCVSRVKVPIGSGSGHIERKCPTQAVEFTNEGLRSAGRLRVDFARNGARQQRESRLFCSSLGRHVGDSLPILGQAEQSTWGSDDHETFPMSSDNGTSIFDYAPRHVIRSPLQSEGAGPASSVVASASPSNRAGLFRAPISGGVQSATSSHSLPHPAIAVRNLIEQARYAHICTIMSRMHHRRRGYPFGSLVEFATDASGRPIFSLSPLAIHTRNLLADPRCTLVVQVPGWSGLANARVTIFGDVYPVSAEEQDVAHRYYSLKHQHGASQQWGNFNFYRMDTISDVYFVGGFGTVAWIDVNEYQNALPDLIAANNSEETLQELNARFSKPLRAVLSSDVEVDDAALISIDSKGVDIRVRQGAQFNVQRLPFQEDKGVETLDHAIIALQKVLDDVAKVAHKS